MEPWRIGQHNKSMLEQFVPEINLIGGLKNMLDNMDVKSPRTLNRTKVCK